MRKVNSARRPPTFPLAQSVLVIAAVAFVVAALFHLAALVAPSLDPSAPGWRHALFVVVNLVAAAGLLRRPRGIVLAFSMLTAQQLASHGAAAFFAWRDAGRIDFASLGVLVVLPIALAALLVTTRRRTSGIERPTTPSSL